MFHIESFDKNKNIHSYTIQHKLISIKFGFDFKYSSLSSKRFFEPDFLQFFIELAANNHKDWFDQNRKRYELTIKEPFKKFVDVVIQDLSREDVRFKELESKECIFRINRDIRFSKDKTPYKLSRSAIVVPGGKKSRSINGVYFEMGPEHFRIYGGVYEAEKDEIQQIREGIAQNADEFKTLCNSQEFKKLYGTILGEKNKVLPSELKSAALDEPLIFNKQWYFFCEFTPEIILEEGLDELVLKCYRIGKPISDFFEKCRLN
jgi:uncharacterized protein (TIGR02453 family)